MRRYISSRFLFKPHTYDMLWLCTLYQTLPYKPHPYDKHIPQWNKLLKAHASHCFYYVYSTISSLYYEAKKKHIQSSVQPICLLTIKVKWFRTTATTTKNIFSIISHHHIYFINTFHINYLARGRIWLLHVMPFAWYYLLAHYFPSFHYFIFYYMAK